jgi:flavorubredoxin
MVLELARTEGTQEKTAPGAAAELVVTPYRVADDTYVIPELAEAPPVGYFYLNSLVIKAREPIVVDTGTPAYREQWLKYVFSLVDPEDVRWIFLSHDDPDHAGNLAEALAAFPNAKLVTTWFSVGRLADVMKVPLDRVRFVYEDETFEAGDRTLVAVRPPFFDNPTTRGLFDPKTGVYWSVDSFITVVPHAAEDAADIAEAAYREGFLLANRLNHPWHIWLDEAKFGKHIDRVQSLPIKTIATCHGPAIRGRMIEEAFAMIREVPRMERYVEPSQRDLEAMLALMGGHSAG